jgi:spore germination protein KC
MAKIACKMVSILLPFLVLSGCWDQKEIEKRAYVYAIGMDKAEEENKFKITYLIVNPEYGSSVTGGGTDEPPHEIISFETNDLITSRNLANAVVAKDITYDLLRLFIVSEKLAKDEQFIRWMYDATKDREIRRDNYFVVTKESVSQFLEKNKPKLETRPHKYFDLILTRGTENGMIPESELHKFFRITEADADLYLAIYGTAEKDEDKESEKEEDRIFAGQLNTKGETNQTQFLGSAVFKEGIMIGKLTGEETRIAILLNDTLEMSDVLTTFPDPFHENYRIATRVVKKRDNDVKMKLKKGGGEINVTIPLYFEILSDHSMVNYGDSVEKRKQLKQSIERKLSSKIEDFVKKTQEEFKGDPFGWSLIARKQFQTIPEYEEFDWMKSYPNLKVNIKVEIKFGEFGRQSELPKLEQMRD